MTEKEIKDFLAARIGTGRTVSAENMLVHASAMVYMHAGKMIGKFFAKKGTTPAQFNVLSVLAHAPESGLNLLQISKKMLVSQGNITRIIDTLYREKHILRREDKNDRRNKLITLTAKGRAFYKKNAPLYANLTAQLCKGLSENAIKETTQNMVSWLKIIEKYEQE